MDNFRIAGNTDIRGSRQCFVVAQSRLQCVIAYLTDATVGAYDERQREGVPVLVGIRGLAGLGVERTPVFAIVDGDVGSVGAYGDPGFGLSVVGYCAAVAVGWVC
jgi:hypothetical protein